MEYWLPALIGALATITAPLIVAALSGEARQLKRANTYLDTAQRFNEGSEPHTRLILRARMHVAKATFPVRMRQLLVLEGTYAFSFALVLVLSPTGPGRRLVHWISVNADDWSVLPKPWNLVAISAGITAVAGCVIGFLIHGFADLIVRIVGARPLLSKVEQDFWIASTKRHLENSADSDVTSTSSDAIDSHSEKAASPALQPHSAGDTSSGPSPPTGPTGRPM